MQRSKRPHTKPLRQCTTGATLEGITVSFLDLAVLLSCIRGCLLASFPVCLNCRILHCSALLCFVALAVNTCRLLDKVGSGLARLATKAQSQGYTSCSYCSPIPATDNTREPEVAQDLSSPPAALSPFAFLPASMQGGRECSEGGNPTQLAASFSAAPNLPWSSQKDGFA